MRKLPMLFVFIVLFSLFSQCSKYNTPVEPEISGIEYIGHWQGRTSQGEPIRFSVVKYLSLVGINEINYNYKLHNNVVSKGVWGVDAPLGYIENDRLFIDLKYFIMDGVFYRPDSVNGSLVIIHSDLNSSVTDTLTLTYSAKKDSI